MLLVFIFTSIIGVFIRITVIFIKERGRILYSLYSKILPKIDILFYEIFSFWIGCRDFSARIWNKNSLKRKATADSRETYSHLFTPAHSIYTHAWSVRVRASIHSGTGAHHRRHYVSGKRVSTNLSINIKDPGHDVAVLREATIGVQTEDSQHLLLPIRTRDVT